MKAPRTTGEIERINKTRAWQPLVTKLRDFIKDILFALPAQIIAFSIAGGVLAGFLTDQIYANCMQSRFDQITQSIGSELNLAHPIEPQILRNISQYNLAWLYISGPGNKVVLSTSPFAPETRGVSSGKCRWRGRTYIDAVVPFQSGLKLHAGFDVNPFAQFFIDPSTLLTVTLPAGYLILFDLFLVSFIILGCYLNVAKPINRLVKAGRGLLDSNEEILDRDLDVRGASAEVSRVAALLKEIRSHYDKDLFLRLTKQHELQKEKQSLEKANVSLAQEFKEHVFDTQRSITELSTKELEDEFINGLARELEALTATGKINQRILEKLNDKFPQTMTLGAFFLFDKKQRLKLDASLGLEESARQLLESCDHQPFGTEVLNQGKALTLDVRDFKEFGLERLAENKKLKTIIYFPLSFNNRHVGLLGLYFNAEGKVVSEKQRVMRGVADLAARSLYRVIIYQEEIEAARTDALTGLNNRKYFYETAPQMLQKATAKSPPGPLSFVMIDGDHFKDINDVHGHQVGDMVLQELAKTIRLNTRHQDEPSRIRGPKDCVVRFGGEEFMVILDGVGSDLAMVMAERMRKSIEDKIDWPGGVPRFSVSIGVATFPSDGDDLKKIIQSVDAALYYVKEELGRNKCCHFSQVPRNFKASRLSFMEGELGVFDPSALLQSLSTANKTGLLTVTAPDRRQLWALFEQGKPIQARLGKIGGANAIVEFISTFDEGQFNFYEKGVSKDITSTKISRLDERTTVAKSMERCLMDAALAQDNLGMARQLVPSADVILVPVEQAELKERWEKMLKCAEPPTADELNLMTAIVRLYDRTTTLKQMFEAMDDIPSWLLWRAASWLISFDLVSVRLPMPVLAKE